MKYVPGSIFKWKIDPRSNFSSTLEAHAHPSKNRYPYSQYNWPVTQTTGVFLQCRWKCCRETKFHPILYIPPLWDNWCQKFPINPWFQTFPKMIIYCNGRSGVSSVSLPVINLLEILHGLLFIKHISWTNKQTWIFLWHVVLPKISIIDLVYTCTHAFSTKDHTLVA